MFPNKDRWLVQKQLSILWEQYSFALLKFGLLQFEASVHALATIEVGKQFE